MSDPTADPFHDKAREVLNSSKWAWADAETNAIHYCESHIEVIAPALREAVEAEREACLKIAEAQLPYTYQSRAGFGIGQGRQA
jgi:hypothetical protein